MTYFNMNKDEKELREALREKDPEDWIKTIFNFNAIDENRIKIEDKKEAPKVEEKKKKNPLKDKKDPKNEMMN